MRSVRPRSRAVCFLVYLIDSNVVLTIHVLDAASLCSVAPSLHELDEELAQYSELLDVPEDAADKSANLQEFGDDMNTLGLEAVQQLSELLPSESYELDQFALRPTAASLGLSNAIKECLGDDLTQSGYSLAVTACLLYTSPSPRDS